MKKRIVSLLIAMVLLCCMPFEAFALESVPDLSAKGSITFQMSYGGVKLDGGRMNICKVGEFARVDGDYVFRLLPSLGGNVLSEKDAASSETAAKLLGLVKSKNLEKTSAPISKGQVVFKNLSVGLYLVWQDSGDATPGYSAIQPFLISIPQIEGSEYVYDIVCKPKVPLKPKPSTPPPPPNTPPPPPELPPTGQLNWPVPVMGVAGFVLFVFGLIFDMREKRAENEK